MCAAMMNGMGMWGPGWMWTLPAGLLLVLVAAGVAVMLAAARRPPHLQAEPPAVPDGSPAVASAKQRYARGELDRAEFERIMDTVLRAEDDPRERPR